MQLTGRPLLDTDPDQRLFVGRSGEIERIERSIRAGLNCLVTGVAGSGKTSLVRAVMYRAHAAGRPRRLAYVRAGRARTAAELLTALVTTVSGHPRTTSGTDGSDPAALLDELAAELASADDSDPGSGHPAPAAVLVLDDVCAGAGSQLFGALRDEVWQLGPVWLVTATPAQALDLVRPPADVFFETRIELGQLQPPEVENLLRRRLQSDSADPVGDPERGDPPGDPAGGADDLVAAVLAGHPDTPRRALEAARELVTAPAVGPTGMTRAQEHRARAAALERLSRPGRMLAQELEAIGWAAASDERLLDRLGWTRTRVIQVIGELRDEGLVQVREERTGRGRPRKVFRVVPAAELRRAPGRELRMTRADLELLHDTRRWPWSVPMSPATLLLVMQAALTPAVDDPDAARIDRRHVEPAIAEG